MLVQRDFLFIVHHCSLLSLSFSLVSLSLYLISGLTLSLSGLSLSLWAFFLSLSLGSLTLSLGSRSLSHTHTGSHGSLNPGIVMKLVSKESSLRMLKSNGTISKSYVTFKLDLRSVS